MLNLMKTKTQNLWDSTKEALRRNIIAPNTYTRKEKRFQNQWLHVPF